MKVNVIKGNVNAVIKKATNETIQSDVEDVKMKRYGIGLRINNYFRVGV